MSEKKNGWELVREVIATNEGDDLAIALEVLARAGASKRTTDALLVVVVDAVGTVRRNDTRNVERSVFGSGSKRRNLGEIIDSRNLRKQLVDECFFLGDGGPPIRWGEATVEQHRAYIAMLEKQIVGTQATITRHEDAITLIESCGVSCLDEIEVAA